MSKCEETPFISAGRGELMTVCWHGGAGAVVIDMVKDQFLHLSVFMTGPYSTQARKLAILRKISFSTWIPKR
jgi:hypothetical protein